VIAIGASTGGTNAVQAIVQALPADAPPTALSATLCSPEPSPAQASDEPVAFQEIRSAPGFNHWRDGYLAQLQRRLNAQGFDAGKPDGLPGPRTRSAIRAFQKAAGLPADGHASPRLLERLREASDNSGDAAERGA